MPDQFASIVEETLSFGRFELYRSARALVSGRQRIRLGARALDILIALVERAGEVVAKKELMAVAWPQTFVDESNLRVHIAALRKLLGDGTSDERFILNIAGRGYLFSAPVTRSQPAHAPPPEQVTPKGLPEPSHQLIGRDPVIREMAAHLDRQRLITIAGPAGVGKSAVASAVSALVDQKVRRLCFVDLSSVAGPEIVPAAIAAALDVSVQTRDPMFHLIAFLADQQILIIMDNCEHVIDAVAALSESILRAVSGVRFLVTSREPLLSSSEYVSRLQPLAVPPSSLKLDAAGALRYPAVELFVTRAASGSDSFDFGDAEAPAVAEICQRLDGLPLAIELVAARVDLFGIGALATDLGERLILGARGVRGATPRRQSIRSALDWSHDLLSNSEMLVFRRFSIFRGPFTLESAVDVLADDAVSVDEVLEAVASLTAKSLVSTDTSGTKVFYRLLHTTRAYASEKLAESGETPSLARRHALHFRDLLARADAQWETMTRMQWLDANGYAIDDVREALDWAFSPGGDLEAATALITTSLPYGFQLSLIDEFKVRAERALDVMNTNQAPVAELRLVTALTQFALNASIDDVVLQSLFARIDDLAGRVTETKYKIEPLLAQVVYRIEGGDYAGALEGVVDLAQSARVADDPLAILAADRIAAQAHHFMGNHQQARLVAERVIRHPARVIPLVYSQATIDRQVTMRVVIARSLWLEGRVGQATGLIGETLDIARADGPLTITYALAMGACLIAFWTGDLSGARRYTDDLLAYSRRYTLDRWGSLGEGFAAALDRKAEREQPRVHSLDFAEPISPMHRMFLATLKPEFANAALVERAERGLCGWCNPEMLRCAGELRLRKGDDGAMDDAERLFKSALADAGQRSAFAWELRAATSLAELFLRRGEPARGQEVLAGVLGRLSEGVRSADRAKADDLLRRLAG